MRTNQTKESWSLSQYFLSRGQNFNWSSQPSFSKVRRKEMESSIREVDCFSLLILFSKIFLLSTNERTTRLKLVLKNSSTDFIAILLTFSVMNRRKSQKVFRLPLKMTTDIWATPLFDKFQSIHGTYLSGHPFLIPASPSLTKKSDRNASISHKIYLDRSYVNWCTSTEISWPIIFWLMEISPSHAKSQSRFNRRRFQNLLFPMLLKSSKMSHVPTL